MKVQICPDFQKCVKLGEDPVPILIEINEKSDLDPDRQQNIADSQHRYYDYVAFSIRA